ncbi:MAG: hypothetical protein ABW202_08000 [Duganella sp.]
MSFSSEEIGAKDSFCRKLAKKDTLLSRNGEVQVEADCQINTSQLSLAGGDIRRMH